MYFSKLTRNPGLAATVLADVDDGSIVTKQRLKVLVPKRYEEHKLAVISADIRVLATYALVVGEEYTVSRAMSMIQLTPMSTNIIDVDNEDYYEFEFDKGSVFTPNRFLVMQDTICYFVYDEYMAKGNSPAFFDYEDLGKTFDTASELSGFNIAASNIPIEMITASICRDQDQKTVYYRHSEMKKDCVNVALRNVSLGATNTTARLNGAYFDQGLRSALINPSKSVEPIETLLRK